MRHSFPKFEEGGVTIDRSFPRARLSVHNENFGLNSSVEIGFSRSVEEHREGIEKLELRCDRPAH